MVYVHRVAIKTRPRTTPVPVRLDDQLSARLRRAARRMGTTTSSVIRFSILQQLVGIERGRIELIDSPQEAGK